MMDSQKKGLFRIFAHRTAEMVGTAKAFCLAVFTIVIWAFLGPVFHYSDTWQLVINTGTTIITFLMVFLIQNSQNRDAKTMQLKLDELLRAMRGARNSLVNLEDLEDDQLEILHAEFREMQEKIQRKIRARSETKPG